MGDEIDEEEVLDEIDDVVEESAEENAAEPEAKIKYKHKKIIIIRPENRRTSHHMTQCEITEIISIRASQIAKKNQAFVDIENMTDPVKIATKELLSNMCPYILRRKVGEIVENGQIVEYIEFWDVNTMTKVL